MPKGWKVDHMQTALARLEGATPRIWHPRSFISLPKATPHTNGVELSHLILYGHDVGAARERAIERCIHESTTKGPGSNLMRCQGPSCGIFITDSVPEMAYNKAEMHHLSHKPWERCWCDANLEMWCRACHSAAHPDGRLEVSA